MYTGSEGLSLQANFVILGLIRLEMLSFITRFNISAIEPYGVQLKCDGRLFPTFPDFLPFTNLELICSINLNHLGLTH